MKNWLLFTILAWCYCSTAFPRTDTTTFFAQQVQYDSITTVIPIVFNPDKINSFKTNKAYDYTEKTDKNSTWEKLKHWLKKIWYNFWKWIFGEHFSENNFLKFLYQLLPYLIISLAVGFVIWVFYKLNPGISFLKNTEQPEVFYTEEEEIIKTQNIKTLINEALGKRNFRLAVRFYYLYIIQQLSETKRINYQFDKTNTDYLNELTHSNIQYCFKKTTNLYDYVWYGNFEITESEYYLVQNDFIQLEKLINQHE